MTPGPESGGSGGADWRRTATCGELRLADVGREVVLNGWVASRRDLGGIYFVDLRDRYGITQIVLGEELEDAVRIGPEFVLSVRGEVVEREQKNPGRETGDIELVVRELTVLSESLTPPIEVLDDLDTAVETRLRYRYLDLRRGPLQQNLALRARFTSALRRAFDAQGFLDIETPMLTRATPEGARDYLVPSRVHPAHFYALPQSPQIFKQILMVSGFDRYYQVARCFRDEDLRADRQPEFTQLDMEMSFVEEEDVWASWETALTTAFQEALGIELPTPFPRMRWAEAMERYGVDKPDTRFGMELVDAAEWAASSGFVVFESVLAAGGRVMGINVAGGAELSRKQITALEDFAKEYGAKGLAWWKAGADGGAGPLARFCEGARAAQLMERMGATGGDLCLFIAAERDVTWRALGELRVKLGRERGLVQAGWNFLWVTHFPMFEAGEEPGTWTSSHHPFTAPEDWDLAGDPAELASRAYDLVLNGWELGSGSVRIHRQDVQERVFELLGLDAAEVEVKFGFLLEALRYGAPPHAGFAMGLDRIVALIAGLDSIRDVTAFPKTLAAKDLMCGAPSIVEPRLLAEVHVTTTGKTLQAESGQDVESAAPNQP